jgi:hypothetical protein
VAPLGLSKAATNPWLPGSDIDPLVLLAWILVLFAPLAAGFVARRRYTRSGSTAAPAVTARQIADTTSSASPGCAHSWTAT